MLPNKKALEIIRKYMKIYNGNNEENIKENIIRKLKEEKVLVETEDGTYTLKADDDEEMMHSKVGALKEAIYKFAKPSKIENLKNPRVLDLCSGLGYNAIAALHHNKNAEIDMVEICEEALFLTLFLDIPYKEHEIIKDKVREYFLNKIGIEYNSPYNNINLYVGDARKYIIKGDKKYNIVFHDAFSPKRDPTLYTYDFLKEIYKRMEDNGVLVSYSSSIPFRSALVDCGFVISEKESIGRKRGITLAYKNLNFKPDRINEIDERIIALSVIALPYRDKNLNLTKDKIIEDREKRRKKLKENLIKIGKYLSTKQIKKGNIPEEILNIQKEDLNSSEIIKKMRREFFKDANIFIL
ncbi:MnmC family methyltransferase [Methanocaldococcus sp. 28A]